MPVLPISGLLIAGTLIAFTCAAIAIGVDLQETIKAQLGALANTSVLGCWQGWVCLGAWGTLDAAMYHFILSHREWASSTLGFAVDQNLLLTALTVGLSAIVIIRSKLAKVGTFEVGGEWAYLWSRARVLNAVNKRRISTKNHWQQKLKPAALDVTGLITFFTDLETHVVNLLQGRPDIRQTVTAQIDDVRKRYIPANDPNPDVVINGNPRARLYLISVALDYLGHRDLMEWARSNNIPM